MALFRQNELLSSEKQVKSLEHTTEPNVNYRLFRMKKSAQNAHTYIDAVRSASYMYDMYVYINIYIKWHPKMVFPLQCMQSFSLSHTFQRTDSLTIQIESSLFFKKFPYLIFTVNDF